MSITLPERMHSTTEDGLSRCRGYMVAVSKSRDVPITTALRGRNMTSLYPVQNGTKSIQLMKSLAGRGIDTRAITSGCGGVEYLTLAEMEAMVIPGW